MKIEMGESLVASYFKHIRKCQIVTTNFKVSPSWITYNDEIVEKMFQSFVDYFNTDEIKTIKGAGLKQFLDQAEIDVLGYDFANQKIIAADVAYHSAGLNYGGKEESARRVIKKTLRTALCLIYYFNTFDGEIIFAAPKTHGTFDAESIINEINSNLIKFDTNFEIKILCDASFKTEIYSPVISSTNYTDTSELFVRSAQLINLMDKIKEPSENNSVKNKKPFNPFEESKIETSYSDKNIQDYLYQVFLREGKSHNTAKNYAHWLSKLCTDKGISNIETLKEKIGSLTTTNRYIYDFKDHGSTIAAIKLFYSYCKLKELGY